MYLKLIADFATTLRALALISEYMPNLDMQEEQPMAFANYTLLDTGSLSCCMSERTYGFLVGEKAVLLLRFIAVGGAGVVLVAGAWWCGTGRRQRNRCCRRQEISFDIAACPQVIPRFRLE